MDILFHKIAVIRAAAGVVGFDKTHEYLICLTSKNW